MTRLLPLLVIMALFLASVSVAHAQTTTPTVSTVAVTLDHAALSGHPPFFQEVHP